MVPLSSRTGQLGLYGAALPSWFDFSGFCFVYLGFFFQELCPLSRLSHQIQHPFLLNRVRQQQNTRDAHVQPLKGYFVSHDSLKDQLQ